MSYTLLAAAILPVIILMIFIYCKDKYQKEPIKLLALAFFGGILAIPLDLLIVEAVNMVYYSETVFYTAFIEAGLCEEFSKFVFLFLFIWRKKDFDEYMDGIVYATFVSLGFACVENIEYVAEFGMDVAIGRAILSVPGHFLFGVAMGYFFGLAKFEKSKRVLFLIMAVLVATLLHGMYDWLLMVQEHVSDSLGIILYLVFLGGDILMWKLGLKYIRKHQQLSQNQAIENEININPDDTFANNESDPEYKHIDWNAGDHS